MRPIISASTSSYRRMDLSLNQSHRTEPKRAEKVLQFGDGNFLRGFIDWMIHRMNRAGVFDGSVVVVRPRRNGSLATLNSQDGLFTLLLRGIYQGKTINELERIESISRGINPYTEWDAFAETARNPEMFWIVSNTTEAGIQYTHCEKPAGECPDSFPAKLTAWLAERFSAFEGSAESGVTCLPCELIEDNGAQLKACILKHASDWRLGDGFTAWIEQHCTFLNTMVDRIVPGFPEAEAPAIAAQQGYTDALLCAAEVYHSMVIEGPDSAKAALPFEAAGLNVEWTDDLQPYRTRKVGILNGAHTSTVLAAYLGGIDTVVDMMQDPDFGPFVEQTLYAELVASLDFEKSALESFAASVIERFQNPYIRHELLSISLNSVSKWSVRVLPRVKRYVELKQAIPERLAFSMAALIAFYKGDLREGYTLKDDPAVLDAFQDAWQGSDCVAEILCNATLWGEDLSGIDGFETSVRQHLNRILQDGTRACVQALNQQA